MKFLIGVLTLLVYVVLYVIGGRDEEWLKSHHIPLRGRLYKRLFAPLSLTIGFLFLNTWSFFSCPIWFLESQISRGKDTLTNKLIWRTLWALFYSIGIFVIGLISSHIILASIQCVLSLSASLYFGVINPFAKLLDDLGDWKAVFTEGAIILSSSIMLPLMMILK